MRNHDATTNLPEAVEPLIDFASTAPIDDRRHPYETAERILELAA